MALKRTFILLPLLALAAGLGHSQDAGANRYNVLFIAVDDLRPPFGFQGAEYVKSPNIDRLASQGVWFSHHYAQVATCGASRYSLLTGRSPSHTGVTASNTAFYKAPTALSTEELAEAQSLPELFRRSGYRTICIGKISHTPDGRVYQYDGSDDGRDEVPLAWDEFPTPFGAWKRGWGDFFAYAGGRHREDKSGYAPLMEFKAVGDNDLPDGLIASTAIEKLRALKARDQRFFLGVGFYKPHLPFVATKGDWDAFSGVDIPDSDQPERTDTAYWHRSGEFFRYDLPFPKAQPLAREDRITARRAYLAALRYADRQVGRVLDALTELELDRNTVVVLWSDHGWHLGENEIWGKHTPLERAMNNVLLIRTPGSKQAGTRSNALVESLDVYPTLVDLCAPSFRKTRYPLDGKSLVPILSGKADSVREAAISFWRDAVTVRTRDHRLIARFKTHEPSDVELYDMSRGPDAVTNLAASEPALVKRLLAQMPSRE